MADYIERQKAINYVLQLFPSKLKADATMGEQVNYSAWCCAVNCAEECIRAVPPADVVEVVRCGDCKFNPNDTWLDCPMAHLPYKEDRWCWKGERKDG